MQIPPIYYTLPPMPFTIATTIAPVRWHNALCAFVKSTGAGEERQEERGRERARILTLRHDTTANLIRCRTLTRPHPCVGTVRFCQTHSIPGQGGARVSVAMRVTAVGGAVRV